MIIVRYVYVIPFMLIFMPNTIFGGIFGPSNYEECILKNMKGVTSDFAARKISDACRAKFKNSYERPKLLPKDDLAKLIIVEAWIDNNGYFSGIIYNGNKNWLITNVTIDIDIKSEGKGNELFSDFSLAISGEYNVYVAVSPLSQGRFSIPINAPINSKCKWLLLKAMGHKN